MDPDVTTTAKKGLYLVYLYRRDLSHVYLSMNQGTTQHHEDAKGRGFTGKRAEAEALAELEQEVKVLRERLNYATLDDLLPEIDLAAPGYFLPSGYEIGNVAAISYDLTQLPDEETLQADLARMIALHDACVEIKKRLAQAGSEKTKAKSKTVSLPPIFRPKSSAAYWAEVKAQYQERSRRHEALVAAFGEWLKACGAVPATNVHPRDLTADAEGHHWLIEAKIVKANAELAVREAIGQLASYRHFWYRERDQPDPALVALFSAPVGPAFVQLLASMEIESIWRDGDTWDGHAPDVTTSLLKFAQANM